MNILQKLFSPISSDNVAPRKNARLFLVLGAGLTLAFFASLAVGSAKADIFAAISDSELAEFFERVAAKGMGVELNVPLKDCTSEAVLRPYGIAQKCGCKFYLGSDAHVPAEFEDYHQIYERVITALDLKESDKFHLAQR